MITAACLILVAAVCIVATLSLCRDDIAQAEYDRDRARALAKHYRALYLAALPHDRWAELTTEVAMADADVDAEWREFMEGEGR